MIFHRVDPSGEYRTIRFLSEGGRWELGMSPYQHGMRLRMGLTGRPPTLMDFCMGHESPMYYPILIAVMECIRELPESANFKELDARFPWAGTRPDLNIHLKSLMEFGKGLGSTHF